MRLKDLIVGTDYVTEESRYGRRTYLPHRIKVLSVDYQKWPFHAIPERHDRVVDVAAGGQTFEVPEELLIARDGGTKGVLVTWEQERRVSALSMDAVTTRYFTVISPRDLVMTYHDYEIVAAEQIAEHERQVKKEEEEAAERNRQRQAHVDAFNAVFGKRFAGRPEGLESARLTRYVEYGSGGTKELMDAALWGARGAVATRKKKS
jgi:hypothetical protein